MWVAQEINDFRARRRALPGTVALVPTMGALHEGHLSLIDAAAAHCDHVLVSVFVNPTQFGPSEDFEQYPRPIDADLEACEARGVAGVLNPSPTEMYPLGVPACELTVPELTVDLEAAERPGHFQGVCRVVLKLLNIAQPDVACFGRKDLQQLRVIQAMVADLNLPIRILEGATIREADGLARSSRNRYLDESQRRNAVGLIKALREAELMIEDAGETDPYVVEAAMRRTIEAHHMKVDYAVVRHPLTLTPIDCIDPRLTGAALVVAARLGDVRLLDNKVIGPSNDPR